MARYVDIEPYEKLEGWTTYVTLTVNRPHSQVSIPVSSIPTADVDEVVRCRDCVFWKEHDGFGKCIEPTSNIKSDVWLNPLFYCRAGVKAERRTE